MESPSRNLSEEIVIFVLGGPGAGKGTLCQYLHERYGLAHYSAGDLLRAECKKQTEKGKMLAEMLANGLIVPSEITIGLLKSAMVNTPNCKAFLIDGFPRNITQGDLFEQQVVPCKFILFLDAPQDIMESRLLKRAQESQEVRSDDNLESIRKRFNTHYEQCMPVIEHFGDRVVKIDATLSTSEVFAQVESKIKEILPGVF